MSEHRIDPWRCFNCGYLMNALDSIPSEVPPPGEGDLAVCIDCAEPHILHAGKFRLLTDDELIGLPLEQKRTLSNVQLAIREMHAKAKRDKL